MYKLCSVLLFPLLILTIIIYPISIEIGYSYDLLLFTLIIVGIVITLWGISTFWDPIKEIRKQYIRPIFLFLLGYLIVFFQAYFDILLGNVDENDLLLFVHPSLINQSALLSCAGLIALLIGYYSKRKTIKLKIKPYKPTPIHILLIIFTFINLVSIYLNLDKYLIASYSQALIEENSGSAASYAELIFYITYLSILVTHTINCRIMNITSIWGFIKSLGVVFYINVGIYLLLIMLSGDRGPIFTIVLTYMGALTLGSLVKIKFKYLVTGVFAGALFLSLLGIVRSMDQNLSFSERIIEAIKDDKINSRYESFLPATAELSTSVRTLHYATENVPANHPYFYGLYQLRESLQIIPFASRVASPLFPEHFRYKSSSYFFTWIYFGEFYPSGTGSSINGDLYLIFGEFSVLIGLFLLGRLFRRIDIAVFANNNNFIPLFETVIFVVLLGSSIYWSRANFLFPLQPVVLTWLMVCFYKKLMIKS